jgi:hypothetical protein
MIGWCRRRRPRIYLDVSFSMAANASSIPWSAWWLAA